MLEQVKKVLIESLLKENPEISIYDERLEKYKDARVIKDLGLNIQEAINILKERGIPIVLNEADKEITLNPKAYTSKDNIIGVHKTNFAPTDSRVKSSKEAHAKLKSHFEFAGEKYEYEYETSRDTVHMSLNSEVGKNDGGNWDICKYAVLIPFRDIENEQIGAALSVDTFTKGGINLTSDAWILCPSGEKEEIRRNNPNVQVIEYEGTNVSGYAQAFLSTLGYHAEEAAGKNWLDYESEDMLKKFLMTQEGIKNIGYLHSDTSFSVDENQKNSISLFVNIYDFLNKNNLVNSSEDILNAQSIHERNCGNINNIIYRIKDENLDIFFEELAERDLPVPTAYQTILKSRSQIFQGIEEYRRLSLGEKRKFNFGSIFPDQEDLSRDESMTIQKLKTTLQKEADQMGNDDDFEKRFKEVLGNFTSIAIMDNMDRVKSSRRDNFVNMERNFRAFITGDFEFQEQQSIFEDRRVFRDYAHTFSVEYANDHLKNGQSYRFSIGDVMNVTYIPPHHSDKPFSGNRGQLDFRYVDENSNTYYIRYNEASCQQKPEVTKNNVSINLEEGESALDFIPASPRKERFEQFFNRIRNYDRETVLRESLESSEVKREKQISTAQIGKRSIRSQTLDKKQIDIIFKNWEVRTKEGEIQIND